MAGAVSQTISRDQEERLLRLITEHKNIMDWQSGMIEARREGIAEGRIEIAKNLLSDGPKPERVAAYTSLSLEDVLKLPKFVKMPSTNLLSFPSK